jgi:hypothetical protein
VLVIDDHLPLTYLWMLDDLVDGIDRTHRDPGRHQDRFPRLMSLVIDSEVFERSHPIVLLAVGQTSQVHGMLYLASLAFVVYFCVPLIEAYAR